MEPTSPSLPAPLPQALPGTPTAPHEDLRYIRQAIDAARSFTAVPGKGLIGMGCMGIGAALISAKVFGTPWAVEGGGCNPAGLLAWLVALTAAMAVGSSAMLAKAARTGQSLSSELFRKVLWGMAPGLVMGGVLTAALVLHSPDWSLLAAIWLGCYGLAVLAPGQFSVWSVRLMGIGFLGLAGLSALTPASWDLLCLAAGFGALHLMFGVYIAWRYDG